MQSNHMILLVMMSLGLAPFGCSDSSSDEDAPSAAAAAEHEYDLVAIMEGMAATMRDETKVLSKAVTSWESIDAADRQVLWSALQERTRLGYEFEAMLKANPQWTESCCGWFLSVVLEPNLESGPSRRELHEQAASEIAPQSRTRYGRLLVDAAGSAAAVKAYHSWNSNHPGAPLNILRMCYKLGYVDETVGGEFRFNPRD